MGLAVLALNVGRKRWASGRITDGEALVEEAVEKRLQQAQGHRGGRALTGSIVQVIGRYSWERHESGSACSSKVWILAADYGGWIYYRVGYSRNGNRDGPME